MKQTIIDVQFNRECDYNVLLKRLEKMKNVESVSGAPYREDFLWKQVTIIHNDILNQDHWETWLYKTMIKGMDGYGVCDSTIIKL